jgi:hypothetical protein
MSRDNDFKHISPRFARRWGQLDEVVRAEHEATAAGLILVGKSSDVWTIFHESLDRAEIADLLSALRELPSEPGQPPTKSELVKQMEILLQLYAAEVDQAELTPASKAHYIDFANCFVRWIRGEFEPGRTAGNLRKPNWNKRTDKASRLPVLGDE